jgi:hypothetical protein
MKKETIESAKQVLERHPHREQIFATEDGNLFFDHQHAKAHAAHSKSEVMTITREDETEKEAPGQTAPPEVQQTSAPEPGPVEPAAAPAQSEKAEVAPSAPRQRAPRKKSQAQKKSAKKK